VDGGRGLVSDVALLVAPYTVAISEERRTAVAAAALEFGVMLALTRWFHGAHMRTSVCRDWLRLDATSRTGREALAEMRPLFDVLRAQEDADGPQRDPQPGVPQIDTLVEQVRAAGLQSPIAGRAAAEPPLEGNQLKVFRIVQEALTNTLKDAGPSATAQDLSRDRPRPFATQPPPRDQPFR